MRRAVGWLLVIVGLVAVVLGAATAGAFGPDNRIVSGPHPFESHGAAIVTAPGAIVYSGPTVQITATTDKPTDRVFVGVGYDVDVRDYLQGSPYTQVQTISLPWDTTTRAIDGSRSPGLRPTAVDWWVLSDSGRGSASVTVPLPDAAVDVVVMDPALTVGFRTEVTVAVVEKGGFVGALAVLVCGLGLMVVGWVVSPRVRR